VCVCVCDSIYQELEGVIVNAMNLWLFDSDVQNNTV
jgi:hypothetical protein